MDSNDWTQPEQPLADGAGGDWRLHLQNDSRQRIVTEIMDTLELRKIAVRLEKKIYHAAISESDYHRKIRLKMLKLESYAIPSNYDGMNRNPQDPGVYPASLDSTAQSNISESQEDLYKKLMVMKDLYYPEMHHIHQKICSKLQQYDSLTQHVAERLEYYKQMIGNIMQCLQMSRSNAQYLNKGKVSALEKQILGVINSHRPGNPGPVLQRINQAHSHEDGQLQSVHVQGSSVATVQSGDTSDMNGSVECSGVHRVRFFRVCAEPDQTE